jgi:hypothetical protein
VTEAEICKWAGRHSIYGEMIFQLLSRGRYTKRQIAQYVGCPAEAVALVARARAREIEKNHRRFLEAQATCRAVLASPAITGYPARPSFCVREFLRNVKIFDRSFRRSARMAGENREDWC